MPNMNFTLCGNKKYELGDVYDYLNQKVITAINTSNGSMLGENYMKMVLYPLSAHSN